MSWRRGGGQAGAGTASAGHGGQRRRHAGASRGGLTASARATGGGGADWLGARRQGQELVRKRQTDDLSSCGEEEKIEQSIIFVLSVA